MEQSYPISALVVKQLNDKLYEKRKAGALEIERLLRDYLAKDNKKAIETVIDILGKDFANAQTPQPRNGGLIGLAACAIALGKGSCDYVEKLIRPPLNCFSDPDQRIRYFACEALYNICKVTRESVLPYFNDLFDGLSKLADDYSNDVRNGSELLDRLIKDIVSESSTFDIPAFIPLLRERIYTAKPFCRRFIVSWISVLNSVPDINMLVYLPDILDGLFLILGEKNPEIKNMCETLIDELSTQIRLNSEKKVQGISDEDFIVDFPSMTNILIVHSQSNDSTIQVHAVEWLKAFVDFAGRQMVPFCPGIVNSILPIFSYSEEHKKCRETAKLVNVLLMNLVTSEDDKGASKMLDVASLVKILSDLLQLDAMYTKIATLDWFLHLFRTIPLKIFPHVDGIFPLLINTLSDISDEVVTKDLKVLAEIAQTQAPKGSDLVGSSLPEEVKSELLSSVSQYFLYSIHGLLERFKTDRALLDEKGIFIVRQLCTDLEAEMIYRVMSEFLTVTEDLQFASVMIRHINIILLTATELFPLRNTLKHVLTEEGLSLFRCLYKSWCHHPVAAVALCLLTQQYRLASELLHIFGDLDITVELLTEVDKLVQLIESPIFIYLRLQLLESSANYYLIKSLYSILMLLPQSEAFKTLLNRLQCVSHIHVQNRNVTQSLSEDNRELIGHFKDLQDKHIKSKRSAIQGRLKLR